MAETGRAGGAPGARWPRVLGCLLALGVLACGQTATPPEPDPAPDPRPAEKIFYLGRIPFLTPTEVVRGTETMLARLAEELGVDRVVLVLAPDYQGVQDLLLDRKVDAAWFGTEAFRDAVEEGAPIEALAVPSRDGRAWYEGVVICRADAGFMTLADLKGKRFAFVDPRSSSGYAAPRRLLEKAGLAVPGDFLTRTPGQPDFLSKHDNVVHAVYFGKTDAGAVYAEAVEDTLAGEPSKQAELMVLARTGRIPNEPIVVHRDVSVAEKVRVREAFLALELDEEEQKVFGGVERFLPYEGPEAATSPSPTSTGS